METPPAAGGGGAGPRAEAWAGAWAGAKAGAKAGASGTTPHRPAGALLRWAQEYCCVCGQHGFKYVALPGQFCVERLCWGLIVSGALLTTFFLVWAAWTDYLTSPVLIAVETSHYPIWGINFPAVTLCSLNKVDRAAAEHLLDTWRLPANASRAQLLEDLSLVTDLTRPPPASALGPAHLAGLARLQALLSLNNASGAGLVERLAPSCDLLLASCRFKGRAQPCAELFAPTRCREGLCCTFNYFGASAGGPEVPLPRPPLEVGSEGPERTSACGSIMGLTVQLRLRQAHYHTTLLASHGVKVLVDEPRNFPSGAAPAWLLGAGRSLGLALTPQLMETAADALAASPRTRNCLAPGERVLPLMREYTYRNCVTECRRNRSAELCGCAPLAHPAAEGERPCGPEDVACLARNSDTLETLLPDGAALGEEGEAAKADDAQEDADKCGCMPECDHMEYTAAVSEGELARDLPGISAELSDSAQDVNDSALLHVFFVDLVGTQYRRAPSWTWYRLLAAMGGLMGLVLGFSLLSGCELVYFFTLRPACAACSARRQGGRQKPELLAARPPPPQPLQPPQPQPRRRRSRAGPANSPAVAWPF